MPRESPHQRKTVGRVMHEYKHGELRGGTGGKVKNPRQAVAIALNEAGASKYQSRGKNQRDLARTKCKEARGETYQQETEGRSHVGARGRRESSRAMGGQDATGRTSRGRKAARTRSRRGDTTRKVLYERARKKGVEGRSRMTKRQLENALRRA